MVTGSALFLLGIITLVQFHTLPAFSLVWLLPGIVAAAVWLPRLRYPACYAGGFLWALLCAGQAMERGLDPSLQGVPLDVLGTVASLPEDSDHYIRFEFRIADIRGPDGEVITNPGRIRLNWYTPHPEVRPGRRLHLTVKLKRPHGYMNPGGFDYEAWLFQRGIRARGYVVRNLGPVKRTATEEALSIHAWRYRLRRKLDAYAGQLNHLPLLRALALGDRSTVSRQQWRVLNRTGTNHLLAISGLHIGLVAGLAFLLARWLWPLAGRTALWLPAPRVAALVSLLAAGGYALLAGFTVPTRRALIMLAVLLLAALWSRYTARRTGFALALLAVLIADPFAVLSPGFWLSFAAVAVILLALSGALPRRGRLLRFARVQWFLFVALAPLLAFWFHQVPLLSIAANTLAIPWVSLVSVPLVLAGVLALLAYPPLAGPLLGLADRSLGLLWLGLEQLSRLEAGLWQLPQVPAAAIAAALAGVLLLLLPRATPARWAGAFWLLPLVFPPSHAPGEGTFRFTLLDVGQGLAAVVQTRHHVLTYDTGPAYGSGFNTGWAVVVPFLQQAGIDAVDLHVQSHGDNDHIGGLEDLLAAVPVRSILSGEAGTVDRPGVRPCRDGQAWQWDGVRFRMLSPGPGRRSAGNNSSCVLRVSAAGLSVLLPGDIERDAEARLLSAHQGDLASTVVVVPHHGSLSSSGEDFVNAVSPRYALFAAGYLNRYGFPKQAIIDRYRDAGAVLFDTASAGAIQFGIVDKGINIRRRREDSSRFWHNRDGFILN